MKWPFFVFHRAAFLQAPPKPRQRLAGVLDEAALPLQRLMCVAQNEGRGFAAAQDSQKALKILADVTQAAQAERQLWRQLFEAIQELLSLKKTLQTIYTM